MGVNLERGRDYVDQIEEAVKKLRELIKQERYRLSQVERERLSRSGILLGRIVMDGKQGSI